MIKQFSRKHLLIASVLTIALCVGFLVYNHWDITRFRKSFVEGTPQKQQSEKAGETPQQSTLIPSETDDGTEKSNHPESDVKNNDIEAADNEEKDVKETDFYGFLDFLDELDEEEFAKLLENLDLEENEKEVLAELAEQESKIAEDIHPSSTIVDFMESGVASLAGLIELMEEAKNAMPESVQERFESTLSTLRTMQVNGGGLMFHRPPENAENWMLVWINPSPGQRMSRPPLDADNIIHEIPSDDPSKPSLFLHKGNSIIID